MSDKIIIGSVVRLLSGSIDMTVQSVDYTKRVCVCCWYDVNDSCFRELEFRLETLKRIDEKTDVCRKQKPHYDEDEHGYLTSCESCSRDYEKMSLELKQAKERIAYLERLWEGF